MYRRQIGPRAAYQERQGQRVKDSPSLAERFPRLKSLTVKLAYHNAASGRNGSELKYAVNIQHAKSVFRFKCPNNECIRGDFDLTPELAEAVAKHDTSVTGEMGCRGITINRVQCLNRLRYGLCLGY